MSNICGIYLGACRAVHSNHNLVYQDIDGKRDIGGDMLEVNLAQYDYIIAHNNAHLYFVEDLIDKFRKVDK